MDVMLEQAPQTARNMRSLVAARNGFNFGVSFTIWVIISIIFYALLIVALWKLFTKAGEKGWKALIPFYNFYILCKIAWNKKLFWVGVILIVASYVFTSLALTAPVRLRLLFTIICCVIWVAYIVFFVFVNYSVSKSFGHGWGYAIGLVFLDFVFILILAFGKSEYVGNAYLQNNGGGRIPPKPNAHSTQAPRSTAQPKPQTPPAQPKPQTPPAQPKPQTPTTPRVADEQPKPKSPQHKN